LKIHEVEKITGLSKKAIRLYESKGLLKIQRMSNSYRDYTEEDIARLKQIKLFRLAGISLSDIRLWSDRIVSAEALLQRRMGEIEEEYGQHSRQYQFCQTVTQQISGNRFDCMDLLEEEEESSPCTYGALAVGIDIGTTTISACVLDVDAKRQVEVYNIPNDFAAPTAEPGFAQQDADGIVAKAMDLLDHILASHTGVTSIGLTGQMHGIVYLDADGHAVSPLTTWQDKRGDRVYADGETYCSHMTALTGERIATGYGFATCYYDSCNGLVPTDAVSFCSIMDYIGMRLTERTTPLLHSSVAASLGFFDVRTCAFKEDKLALLSLGTLVIPSVTDDYAVLGCYRDIPVSVAIGDNQASFLGSVKVLDDSILVNIGTGSQISMVGEGDPDAMPEGLELRPLVKGKSLICGSALGGGAAYALLERFFRSYTAAAGLQDVSQYEIMNRISEEAYVSGAPVPTVHTTFFGTRNSPAQKGGILDLDGSSFHPASLTLGVIRGICGELYDFFTDACVSGKHTVVASGGAVRKIKVLKYVIRDTFEMPVYFNTSKEEASVGAALFSTVAAKTVPSLDGVSGFIQYQSIDR